MKAPTDSKKSDHSVDTIHSSNRDFSMSEQSHAEKEEIKELAMQYYDAAVQCVSDAGAAKTALLQRRLNLSYPVAATIMDMMEANGVIGPYCGPHPRAVLIPSSNSEKSSFEVSLQPSLPEEPQFHSSSHFVSCMDLITQKGTASADLLTNSLGLNKDLAEALIHIYENDGLIGPDLGNGVHHVYLPLEKWKQMRPQYAQSPESTTTVPTSSPQSTARLSSPKPAARPSAAKPTALRSTDRLTLADLDRMEGHKFEHACAAILIANGYSHVKVTRASGDYGIDVLANRDGHHYAIQCKCYNSPVGNHAIQEAFSGAAYYGGRIPVVMTNQSFTGAAKRMAKKLNVHLWGRNVLSKLLITYNNIPLYQQILHAIFRFLLGTPSSVMASLAFLFALYETFNTTETRDPFINLIVCILVWAITKIVLIYWRKKLLRKRFWRKIFLK